MKPTLLFSLLVAVGCGGNAPSSGLAPRACPGDRLLTVTNDWNGAVEIYARVEGWDTRRALGAVLAGARAEFVAPTGTREVFALQVGHDEPNAVTMAMRKYVRFRYTCR